MNGVLGNDSALQSYTEPGKNSTNEMNFVMNHAPCVQDRSLDLLTSSPARYH